MQWIHIPLSPCVHLFVLKLIIINIHFLKRGRSEIFHSKQLIINLGLYNWWLRNSQELSLEIKNSHRYKCFQLEKLLEACSTGRSHKKWYLTNFRTIHNKNIENIGRRSRCTVNICWVYLCSIGRVWTTTLSKIFFGSLNCSSCLWALFLKMADCIVKLSILFISAR
jgi:hypothetical protein